MTAFHPQFGDRPVPQTGQRVAELILDRRGFVASLGACALLPGAAFAQPIRHPIPRPAPPLVPAPDREAMVPVEGGRIYVRINGRLAGPRAPLLLIHGGPGGSHASFLGALPLADERAIVLYDQLDSGRSDQPGDPANWRVARFVDEVDAIRRALALPRLHLLGASWGGTIALEYAAHRPAGLASTVLESPLVSTRSWLADANALRGRLPAATRGVLESCERPAPPPISACEAATADFYRQFNRRTALRPEFAAYARALPVPFNRRLYETMWGASEFVSTGSLRDYDGEPLLARLDGARTLFLGGQYDEARPATLAAFAERVPGASFAVIEDAAHSIPNDNPDAWRATLRRWLRRHDA